MNPIWIAGAFLGVFTLCFLIAFFTMKDKKEALGFDRNMKDSVIIRRLLRYARPYRGSFALVGLVMVFTVVSDIVLPLIIGDVTGILTAVPEGGTFDYGLIITRVLLYAGLLLLSLLCTYVQAVVLQKVGQKIVSAVRTETFSHIQSLSHRQLSEIPVGTLVTRVTNDTQAISRMFTGLLVNLVKNICLILGVTAAMFLVNIKLTLMTLCFSPFIVVFTVIFRKFTRRAFRRVKTATTDINIFLSENLSGIQLTQAFCQEDTKLARFREKNRTARQAKERQIFVFGIFRPSIYMLYIFSTMCLFYIGGMDGLNQAATFGQVITASTIVIFYQYINKFFTPVQNLAEQFNAMQSAFASAEKIFTILDIVPDVADAPGAVDAGPLRGEIEFRDVWFAYTEGNWVLRGVSFHVLPGETAAFVGPTGAGKSTILALLCRNRDIQRGQILVDGRDIRSYTISSLRRQMGQMLQDVFLFSGTIRSNITLKEESFTDDQVQEACRAVNADHLIARLERGLDEPVLERGSNFSAGERQLLSFARTVLHRPRVMILDEATANIDTETEVLIQDSLEHMRSIGTMLMVAHRLSTIQHADRIFVLSAGQIVERGNHQELLALKGRYYELYRLQFHRQQLLAEV